MDLYFCRRCDERYLTIGAERPARCPECGGWLAHVWMPEVPRAEPGSYPDGPRTYASLDEFARADPARLTSREVDFGVLWRERSDARRSYRAAWIEDTGELYVVQAGPSAEGGGHVEVLGMTDRAGVEAALKGWQARVREVGSLAWIRSRARRLPTRPSRSMRRAGAVALGATMVALGGSGLAAGSAHELERASPAAQAQLGQQSQGDRSAAG